MSVSVGVGQLEGGGRGCVAERHPATGHIRQQLRGGGRDLSVGVSVRVRVNEGGSGWADTGGARVGCAAPSRYTERSTDK
mgnify:CR=1 FL=1